MLSKETMEYLLKRQRKEVLEHCETIAVAGITPDPRNNSYVQVEKLLGYGLSIMPILPGCKTFLGVSCYNRLQNIPGPIDVVLVYPEKDLDLLQVAQDTVEKGAKAFWVEEGEAGEQAREILVGAKILVFEGESLELDYSRHFPFLGHERRVEETKKKSTVRERMTRRPVTVFRSDGMREALDKMKTGHFRHLPVVDENGRVIGMLSDRDVRLIRPSLAFVSQKEASRELWSTAVEQAAVFDPVTTHPDETLEHAAQLMLRWEVGALPVVRNHLLCGIITYTDILREFVARGSQR